MREVANVLDEKESDFMIGITKDLMQKGIQYSQTALPEQRTELINALKLLIKELKECTDVDN